MFFKKSKRICIAVLICSIVVFFFSYSAPGLIQNAENDNETGPDIYEPDDNYSHATLVEAPPVCGYEAEIQHHNFHDAGDEDWVKFYAFEDIPYSIKVKNPGSACDAVIELYDTDGVTLLRSRDDYLEGEDEFLEWLCRKEGIYYVKVRQYDAEVFGENAGYDLVVYVPLGGEGSGVIAGMITDISSGETIDGASITTTGGVSSISIDGYYIMLHPAGAFTITVNANGYMQASAEVTVEGCSAVNKDFSMIPLDKPSDNSTCLVESVYGADSVEVKFFRNFRDDVLNKTPEGQEIISLYYKWSPVIVKTIKENEEIKEKLKTVIDGILPLCNGTSVRKQLPHLPPHELSLALLLILLTFPV